MERFISSFRGLAVLFVLIGSCLIFLPPIIPEESLQVFGEMIFPLTPPGTAGRFLVILQALGIEFYGGAILALAFGAVEEKQDAAKQKAEDVRNNALMEELNLLKVHVEGIHPILQALSDDVGDVVESCLATQPKGSQVIELEGGPHQSTDCHQGADM